MYYYLYKYIIYRPMSWKGDIEILKYVITLLTVTVNMYTIM